MSDVIERPGQPGKNGEERAGLVGRELLTFPSVAVDPLTEDQIMAAAFCVDHMIEKHGFSSIVSRSGARVSLDDLYASLVTERGNSRTDGEGA